MRLNEADAWIKSISAIKAIQNVLIYPGFVCDQCQHCTRNKKSMREHFSNKYKGLKISENSQECMIQMSFKIGLQKYIQVNEFDDEMIREEENDDDEGWNKMLEEKFEESIEQISISGMNEHEDLRLMGAFIVRIR